MVNLGKHLFRMLKTFLAFQYDFVRYVFNSGMSGNMNDDTIRGYTITRTYHSLEKSLSFKNRNANRGWEDAYRVGILSYENKYHQKHLGQQIKPMTQLRFDIPVRFQS